MRSWDILAPPCLLLRHVLLRIKYAVNDKPCMKLEPATTGINVQASCRILTETEP
jgi:hypothetical protein